MLDIEKQVVITNNVTSESAFNVAVTPAGPFSTNFDLYPLLFWPSSDFSSMLSIYYCYKYDLVYLLLLYF